MSRMSGPAPAGDIVGFATKQQRSLRMANDTLTQTTTTEPAGAAFPDQGPAVEAEAKATTYMSFGEWMRTAWI